MHRTAVVVIAIVAMLVTRDLCAQDDAARIGLEGGWSYGSVTTLVPVYAGSPDCGTFKSGSVSGFRGGLTLNVPLLFGSFGALLRLGYASSSSAFTAAPVEPLILYEEESDTIIEIPREYSFGFDDARIESSLLATIRVIDRLTAAAGVRLGVRTSSVATQLERITSGNRTFAGSAATEQALPSPTVIEAAPIVADMTASMSYWIPIGGHFAFEPTIGVDFAPFSSIRNVSWRDVRVAVSLPVTYSASTPRDTVVAIVEPPPIAPQAQPIRSRIDATIELRAVDNSGAVVPTARVAVYETIRRARISFEPSVEFAVNSAGLPSGYLTTRRIDALRFDPDSLGIANPALLERRALDIVGWRMRRRADARIVLTAPAQRDEQSWLGYARAEAVRNYLEDVWDVPRARIEIRSTEGRRVNSSAQRVTIAAEPRALIDPYFAEYPDRAVDPPLVQLYQQFTSDAGVDSATIVLRHDGRFIRKFDVMRGEKVSSDDGASLNWQITSDRVGAESALTAELRVRDSIGLERVVESRLPVELERHTRSVTRTRTANRASEVIEAELFATEPSSSVRNRAALIELARLVRAGARITVAGAETVRSDLAAEISRLGIAKVVVKSAPQKSAPDDKRTGPAVRITIAQSAQ